ncbi:MAG: hypothetical protein LC126_16540 [Bryobacterales bacterium]|nr:hypothetical protein [Bryobacterales bacterium]
MKSTTRWKGVQAMAPRTRPSSGRSGPGPETEQAWRRFRKPVLFPEAGDSSLEAPYRQPRDETPRKLSMRDQARRRAAPDARLP